MRQSRRDVASRWVARRRPAGRRGALREAALAVVLLVGPLQLAAAPALADTEQGPEAAAASFAAGEAAFRAGDFDGAGRSFDAAYEQAPHHSALWNAARAWDRAGERARAADRYAQYLEEAPPTAPDRAEARSALDTLELEVGVLEILPPELTDIRVDGERPRRTALHHVSPGEHEVTAFLDGRAVVSRFRIAGGERRQVVLDAPPPAPSPPPASVAPPPTSQAPAPPAPRDDEASSSGWPAWIALTSGGLTVLAGAHIVWSGIDTLNARDDFDAQPTQEALDDGIRRQQRTNFLVGLTAVLGGFTIVALALTDWGGDDETPTGRDPPRAPSASVQLGAGSLVLSGSF